jgi:hypothetical protein
MQKYILFSFFYITLFFLVFSSCKKDKDVNPYDDPALKKPVTTPVISEPAAGSFAYLHKYIFKPTCANSGCHDGTFEPEFRTVYSAYNSLVYQPVKSNNSSLMYKYRVVPGDKNMSLLYGRLTHDNMGQGRMPLPPHTQQWILDSAKYVQQIANWISSGAKDMFDNPAVKGNTAPVVIGIQVFPSGSTSGVYTRGSGADTQPIEVPANQTLDIWFAFKDDSTQAQNLSDTQVKLSTKLDDFSAAVISPLSFSSLTGPDFWGASTTYTHKGSISTTGYTAGMLVFIHVTVKDQHHSVPSEMPDSGTSPNTSRYFVLKIK